MMRSNHRAAPVDGQLLSQSQDAIRAFEHAGGHLTLFSNFGIDPLEGRCNLIAGRERLFHERFPDFGPLFHTFINGDSSLFRDGLTYLIGVSVRLHNTI